MNRSAGSDSSSTHTVVQWFNALNMLGFFLLAVTVLPALLSSGVPRMRSWNAMMLSGLFYCLSYFILIGIQSGRGPSFGRCLVSASMIYTAPVMLCSFMLAFNMDLLAISLHALRRQLRSSNTSKWLIILPAVIDGICVTMAFLIGLLKPKTIGLDVSQIYCHSSLRFVGYVTDIIIFMEGWTMIVLQSVMIYLLVATRKELGLHRTAVGQSLFPIALFIRTLMFTLLTCFGVGGSAYLVVDAHASPNWILILTIPPIILALTFGTQKDILMFYWSVFRRMGQKKAAPPQSVSMNVRDEDGFSSLVA
ncbi:hypothetical protein BDZ89DRAFT_483782 [Hymenopellis radicata]|nr:hypothetical protein BDZ89DRAFT_483782 [Hymenopellis radicata]